MDQPSSVGDRFRSWIGLDSAESERFAFFQKLERAEEDIALLRLAVVAVNGLAFLGLGIQGAPMRTSAILILAAAFAYSVAIVLLQARGAFRRASWSLATVLLDAVAISAWLATTGGWGSPYFPLWYASIAAVGYRSNLPITTAVSGAYVAAYAGVIVYTGSPAGGGLGAWAGTIPWVEFGLRSVYIPITGAIVGLASEGYVDAEQGQRHARKQLASAVEAIDRRLEGVLDEAPDRIVVTDQAGIVEYANHPPTELGFISLQQGGARADGLHFSAIRRVIEDRKAIEYLASPEEVDSSAPFWCRMAPVREADTVTGVLLVARPTPQDFELQSSGRPRRRHASSGQP